MDRSLLAQVAGALAADAANLSPDAFVDCFLQVLEQEIRNVHYALLGEDTDRQSASATLYYITRRIELACVVLRDMRTGDTDDKPTTGPLAVVIPSLGISAARAIGLWRVVRQYPRCPPPPSTLSDMERAGDVVFQSDEIVVVVATDDDRNQSVFAVMPKESSAPRWIGEVSEGCFFDEAAIDACSRLGDDSLVPPSPPELADCVRIPGGAS